MVEPTTAVGAGLAILGSKDLIIKLLGPTADYLGEGLKTYTEKGANNIKRIFGNAIKRLGNKINEPGQVPPKVLKGILTEGYFCEDKVSAEYFGGVLASSRSGISRDDRGATFLNLISNLSSYQIRTHYILYFIARKRHIGKSSDLRSFKMSVYIPDDVYFRAMDLKNDKSSVTIYEHSIIGLQRHELVSEVKWQDKSTIDKSITFTPTLMGMELYLWAHGLGNISPTEFYSKDYKITTTNEIDIS